MPIELSKDYNVTVEARLFGQFPTKVNEIAVRPHAGGRSHG